MKYRISRQSDNYSTYYIVQYKTWGLWWTLGYWDNNLNYSFKYLPLHHTFKKQFKSVEDAEKDVLAFFKFKNNKTKTVIKKEGEVK